MRRHVLASGVQLTFANVRKKYKEAATMLHPDKQHGRDEASRRRTAMAWQRVSAAHGRVMAALGAAVPDG